MLWNITNVILFHVLIGLPSILLQLMDITIKLMLLCNITLNYDMLSCNEIACDNSNHKLFIDNMYLCIIKVLYDSSHNLILVVGTKGNVHPITGSTSKLRFGAICDIINSSRAGFKQC